MKQQTPNHDSYHVPHAANRTAELHEMRRREEARRQSAATDRPGQTPTHGTAATEEEIAREFALLTPEERKTLAKIARSMEALTPAFASLQRIVDAHAHAELEARAAVRCIESPDGEHLWTADQCRYCGDTKPAALTPPAGNGFVVVEDAFLGGYFETLDAPDLYEALEIHGVRHNDAEPVGSGSECQISDHDPHFFSVYARRALAGTLDAAGDFPSVHEATAYAVELSARHGFPITLYSSGGKKVQMQIPAAPPIPARFSPHVFPSFAKPPSR